MQELSMNVLDVAENSVAAGATLTYITVDVDTKQNLETLEIIDNGKGMSEETVKNVTDPFYTTRKTRKVGLGLPLLKMAAEMTGGNMNITSQQGKGTSVKAQFVLDSIDLMPLGDIASTIAGLIQCNPDIDFVYTIRKDDADFIADTREIKQTLDGVSVAEPAVAVWIREYLQENTDNILQEGATQ